MLENAFIYFAQVIYGVPMQSDMTVTPQHYILMAEDSHGQIASEVLQVGEGSFFLMMIPLSLDLNDV